MSSRRGLGKLRHVQTRYLWIQQQLAQGLLDIARIKGVDNMSDVLTKDVSCPLLDRHCGAMGLRYSSEVLKSAKKMLGG